MRMGICRSGDRHRVGHCCMVEISHGLRVVQEVCCQFRSCPIDIRSHRFTKIAQVFNVGGLYAVESTRLFHSLP